MSYLLIGSSNIYRFHKLVAKNDQKYYKLTCCTNAEVWNNTIDDIKAEKGEVIISIIENLICDAVMEITDPEARKLVIIDVIGSFLAQVKKCAQEHPGVKFALVQLMQRPKHQWYTDNHVNMCKIYSDLIKDMNLQSVAKIEGSPTWSQVFGNDGVHLTEASGKVFVETVISNAEVFFKQEIVDLEEEERMNEGQGSEWIAKRIDTVEREIVRLNRELRERNLQDSIVTARIREEIDFMANIKKEDRMIITGLNSKIPMPKQTEEKKKWLNDIVGEILNKIEPGAASHIVFASLGSRNQRFIPLVEVKLDSRDLAMKIRKQFAQKKKETDFGRVFIANSVTLGTRVRVDILKAMAEHYSTDKETLSVSAFISRPVLHVKSKEGGFRVGTYNFSDALTKYGANLTQKELNAAYKRAGSAFKGQMQQNFVVLSEHGFGEAMDEARAGPTGVNETVRGKRPREVGRLDSQIGTPKKQAKKQN